MTKWRHYRTEYGDWHLISEGENPQRFNLPDPRQFNREWAVYPFDLRLSDISVVDANGEMKPWPEDVVSERITPPAYESTRFWIYHGEWRQNPARKWSVDREGIHAIEGAVMGALVLLNLVGIPLWAIGGLIGFALWSFLRYEETEEAEIDDRAYRDIFGWRLGFIPTAIASLGILAWLG